MCAGYGLELSGPNSAGTARRLRGVAFGDEAARPAEHGPGSRPTPALIPPGDTPAGRALLDAWAAEHAGRARITGRKAQNLNPLILDRGGERELRLGWWWLHVGGVPAKFSAFNSRADRLLSAWREPFQHRALLPASWYVEKGVRFSLPGGEQFAMAAVTASAAEGLDSYSLVTRGALGEAAEVHDRMPLVLPRELHDEWLDPARAGDASLVRRVIIASEQISQALVPLGPDAHVPPAGDAAGKRFAPSGEEHPRLF